MEGRSVSIPNPSHPLSTSHSILSPHSISFHVPTPFHSMSPLHFILSPHSISFHVPTPFHSQSPLHFILSPHSISFHVPIPFHSMSPLHFIISPQSMGCLRDHSETEIVPSSCIYIHSQCWSNFSMVYCVCVAYYNYNTWNYLYSDKSKVFTFPKSQ